MNKPFFTINKFTKAAIIVMMLAVMPLKSWAQTPYRPYADEGIVLNFFEIDNIDFRLYLLYNLSHDDRFVLTPENENGLFVLTPDDDNEEGAFLDIDNGLGAMSLYFPKEFRMSFNFDNGLGKINIHGECSEDETQPLVKAQIDNGLGQVDIYFV